MSSSKEPAFVELCAEREKKPGIHVLYLPGGESNATPQLE
jgi:hypothetical protein